MGVLALGSAHARPSARAPINMNGNFQVHVSAESPSNMSPNPSEVVSKVLEPQETFENTPLCPPKNSIKRGIGGIPDLFRVWNPRIFVTQGLMPSFGTLGQLLKLPPLFAQIQHSAVGRGVPDFFLIGIIIFL